MGRILRFFNGEVTDIQPLDGFLVADGTDLGEADGPAAQPLTAAEKPVFVRLVSDVVAESVLHDEPIE
jgi:hypothetical protein